MNSGLIQVHRASKKYNKTPTIEVKGKWVEQLGFTIGGVLLVKYEHGVIAVKQVSIDDFNNVKEYSQDTKE